jgi:hypothetical protein
VAKLSHEVQAFIVQSFARWRKLSLIQKDVKAEFGITLDRRQIDFYNPESGGNKRLAKQWKNLFEETRRAYINGTVSVGIAHKSFRLDVLHRIAEEAEDRRNWGLLVEVLQIAAKEQGGLFTNQRRLDVNPRDALAKLLGCTPDELPVPEDREWLN